jgi:four helix bundle protein
MKINSSNSSSNGSNSSNSNWTPAVLSQTGFQAYDLSIDLIRALVAPTAVIRRHSRSLADQIERASQSIPLNLREGAQRRGADRKHLYTVAAGSAGEVRAVLDVAVARGWLVESKLEPVRQLLDREGAMLFRLTQGRLA